jgi:hypothetical protein
MWVMEDTHSVDLCLWLPAGAAHFCHVLQGFEEIGDYLN